MSDTEVHVLSLAPAFKPTHSFLTVHFVGLLCVMLRAFVGVEIYALCAYCDYLVRLYFCTTVVCVFMCFCLIFFVFNLSICDVKPRCTAITAWPGRVLPWCDCKRFESFSQRAMHKRCTIAGTVF